MVTSTTLRRLRSIKAALTILSFIVRRAQCVSRHRIHNLDETTERSRSPETTNNYWKSLGIISSSNVDDIGKTIDNDHICSTREPHDLAELSRAEKSFEKFKANARSGFGLLSEPGSVRIDVYFHVIQSVSGAGAVSDVAIDRQIEVLNDAFGGRDTANCGGPGNGQATVTPFVFEKAGVERITNDEWWKALPETTSEKSMKNALHQGDCSDLNFYINSPGDGFLGWAKFPTDCRSDPKGDGIVVYFETLPGGNLRGFDQGDTAVHEVGHWLGLLHTFQGGCWGGDAVDDTPAQSRPSRGCSTSVDSCWFSQGNDPIHNYMDYSNDCCMYQFTYGQSERMKSFHQYYRQGDPEKSDAPSVKSTASVEPSVSSMPSQKPSVTTMPSQSTNHPTSFPTMHVVPEYKIIYEGTWGEWKPWSEEVGTDYYACGGEIRYDHSIPFWGDMTSANGLKLTFCSKSDWNSQKTVSIYNGIWGEWKGVRMCPFGSFVAGANVKYEQSSWFGDTTAINGLRISCINPKTKVKKSVYVYRGMWGSWRESIELEDKFVTAGRVKFEDPLPRHEDDTAWNGLEFKFA